MRPKNLQRITTKFGRAYARSKRYDDRKEHWKKEFFAACTQQIERERRLPRQTVTSLDGREWVLKHYPGWHIIDQDEDELNFVIERDPNLIAHTYINPEDGMVYQRGIQESGPSLDDERLREEDPDLWKEISEEVRVVKDPSTWTEEQMERAQEYMLPGTIKTRLVPPRKAKPDELDLDESP